MSNIEGPSLASKISRFISSPALFLILVVVASMAAVFAVQQRHLVEQ